jgi:hypothetical protein
MMMIREQEQSRQKESLFLHFRDDLPEERVPVERICPDVHGWNESINQSSLLAKRYTFHNGLS